MAIILHDITKVRVRKADETYRKLTHDEYAIEGQIRDAELLLAKLQWDLRDVKAKISKLEATIFDEVFGHG